MIKLFSETLFNESKYKEQLPLECMQCHSTFYKSKKRIIQSYDPETPMSGGFCSSKCWSVYSHFRSTTQKNCSECGKEISVYNREIKANNFCSTKCSSIFYNRPRKKVKITKARIPKPLVKCKHCGTETKNSIYCNGTCRNKDQNKNKNGSRSFAETVLSKKLKLNFPHWTIVENDRTILDGLELDIFIPNLNVAIEWNGIYHLEPIKGDDALKKILIKDSKKIEMCKEKGISLITISDRTSHKKFIEQTTDELVNKFKQLEMARWVGNAPT